MCYHAEFGRSKSKGVDINRGEPQIWGALGFRLLQMGGVADPNKQAASPHVLPRQILLFRVKGCTHKYNEPPKFGSTWAPPRCGWVVNDPLKYAPPYACYSAVFSRSRSNDRSVIKEIRQKNLTLRVSLFEVTQGHRNGHGSIRHL